MCGMFNDDSRIVVCTNSSISGQVFNIFFWRHPYNCLRDDNAQRCTALRVDSK